LKVKQNAEWDSCNLKHQEKENKKHKPAIENKDLLQLKFSQVLALTSPPSPCPQCVVPYRPLQEGQRTLKTTSIKFEEDPTGRNSRMMAHA